MLYKPSFSSLPLAVFFVGGEQVGIWRGWEIYFGGLNGFVQSQGYVQAEQQTFSFIFAMSCFSGLVEHYLWSVGRGVGVSLFSVR